MQHRGIHVERAGARGDQLNGEPRGHHAVIAIVETRDVVGADDARAVLDAHRPRRARSAHHGRHASARKAIDQVAVRARGDLSEREHGIARFEPKHVVGQIHR